VIPYFGNGIILLEHAWSNTNPQFRQWCFRFVKVNAVLHRMHTSESTHAGAVVVVSKCELVCVGSGGNSCPPAFNSLYTSTRYANSGFGLNAIAQDWNNRKNICLTSAGVVCCQRGRSCMTHGILDHARHLIHKLLARNLRQEVITSILDASVDELFISLSRHLPTHRKGIHLHPAILAGHSPLQALHGRLWLDSFRADHVGDLEVVGHVL
jgi:hypothetical protein